MPETTDAAVNHLRIPYNNLVALVGFCDEKSNENILVYEYVTDGSLPDNMIKKLNTIQRFEICLGAARGIEHLHTLKLSKVLLNLDENTVDDLHVTKESDVYAFGVVLLEVLCGVSELVDTEDYVEKHVTVIVPKKMKGSEKEMRSVVHRDIRKEVKMEALETYLKIACECVVEEAEKRPTMGRVVEELEKALKLQGGEVTHVQIPGNGNVAGANDETVVEDGSKDDGGSVTVESSISEKEHEEASVQTIEEDVKDLKAGDKLDDAGEGNGDEVSLVGTVLEASNGEKITVQATDTEVQDPSILKSDRVGFSEATEDELQHLRIPFNEIKFGKKIDVRGYGITMFEGEYNHQQVALKRLNITNLSNIKRKLLSAIVNIYRFHEHPNLVALIGFCDESNKEIIIVYEYVSGGNLADKMSKHLTTIQRLQICLGAARGVEYLHTGIESVDSNPGIIHGDIKLSKILLNPDSASSTFEAKVSGFRLPKLLPGQVEIVPRSLDKLTKEADVYAFGVVLLEVLCGVPELVDTDDYIERHVTELVPKRLEQNMLRKIVHFDIRDEIKAEALETYARIACRCVMKNAEERPSMTEVVVELEKALRLQGGKVSDVQIFGSSNGNSLPEVPVGEDDHEGDDNGQSSNVIEEESKVTEETIDDINLQGQSNDVETVPEDAEKENGDMINDHESTQEITVDLKSNDEANNIGEVEVNNEYKFTTTSKYHDGNGLPDEVPARLDLGPYVTTIAEHLRVFERHPREQLTEGPGTVAYRLQKLRLMGMVTLTDPPRWVPVMQAPQAPPPPDTRAAQAIQQRVHPLERPQPQHPLREPLPVPLTLETLRDQILDEQRVRDERRDAEMRVREDRRDDALRFLITSLGFEVPPFF